MPRKKTKSLVRVVTPDRKYGNIAVQRLINKVMLDGKKQVAETIVYDAIEEAAKRLKSDDPIDVYERAPEQHQAKPRDTFTPSWWC